MTSFDWQGRRIGYETWGRGPRTLILAHGLLMNRGMYAKLAPEMAARDHRVIAIDLLGHGESEAPGGDLSLYSMTSFADQIAALMDHLELDRAVVGGTSLGANVSLEFAVRHPERTEGLFIEMPVLDSAIVAIAIAFAPVLVTTSMASAPLGVVAALARRLPRSHYLVDIGLDWLRRDPKASSRVLRGLLAGRTCPPRRERETIEAPALVIGHPNDPIHPFSDSDALVGELRNARLVDANSIIEWRLRPERLDAELDEFLRDVWDGAEKSLRSVA